MGSGAISIFSMRPFHYTEIYKEARSKGLTSDEALDVVRHDLMNELSGGSEMSYRRIQNGPNKGKIIMWDPTCQIPKI
jgi:hypothetical protein